MKQKLLILLWLALAGAAFGQGPSAGPVSITSTQCAKIGIGNSIATVGIQVTGTWTGTLQPEVSISGQAPVNTQVTPSTSTTAQSTITANGVYRTSVAALTTFLLCGNSVSSGTAVVYLVVSEATSGSGGAGGGSGTLTSVTAGNGLNATTNPITTTGTISLLNPLDGVLTIDGVDHSSFGGANTTNMCTGLKYVNDNPAIFIYKVIDALAYDSEAKDPWNDATCANAFNHVTGAMVYEFGTMNFIIGWGGTLHIPASAIFELGGRGSENQLSLANGCGTATPTQCTGTLFAAYQTASPFTTTFAMTCPGCTLFPTGTPVIDYAGSAVSSSGTQLNGPGTVSCAGIGTSIGVQNTGAQEQSSIRDITIVGCQTYGLDVHTSTAQNFNMGPGVEILSGAKTGATIGTPSTFIGVNWSVNGPNRDLGNVTCNTRGAATTTSIAACIAIVGPGGARMPTGRIHDIHTENVKIAVLVDGARNFKIENVNTGSATQDGSTPSTMVYICGAASAAPCATTLTSSKIKVEELAIISPSLMPNYIIDDTNTITLTTSTWTNEYDTDPPRYGSPLTVAAGGTGDITLPASGILYGNGTNAVGNITPPTVNGFYNCGHNVTASTAVAPTCVLQGVAVTANSTNYSLLYSDRASYQKISGGTTATLTLGQITSNFASNYPFVTGNFNSGNVTLQANAADKIDNSATGGTATVLPNFAAFTYSDSSSAPGNWWTVKFPMFAAFPACADTTGNHLNFATATGFSCGTSSSTTALAESAITGAAAATTITEGGATFSITRAGVATANLTAPWVFQNTNSSNNNTSIGLGVTTPGTSTGQTTLNVNGASTGGDLADFGTGGTWTAGVLSGQTIVGSVLINGAYQAKGTTAGFTALSQGSTSAAVTPCNAANTICHQAPTSVTSYVVTEPGAAPAASGSLKSTTTAGVETYTATIPAASDPNGGIHNFNQAAQSQVVVSATEYYITRSDLDMPAAYNTAIGAGTVMKWRITLNKTAAGTGTFQILLKKGTNGSTADTSIVTQTIGTQTAAVDNMEADIQLVWTSTTAAYWTIIPRQSAASGTGFGLVYPAVAAQFNGTISGQTTTTASDKYGLSVIFTTGTPTFIVDMVQAEAFGVN